VKQARRAWRPIRLAKERRVTSLRTTTTDVIARETVFDPSQTAAIVPGGAFAEKHAASNVASATPRLSNERRRRADVGDPGKVDIGVAAEFLRPDFRGAMERSASRKASAEQTLGAVLSKLEETPKKKRAARKLRKDIAGVFSDD